jgi:ATP-dependent protease ClpP protease subunit
MAWTIKATNENEAEILLYDIIGGYNDDWVRQSAKNFIDKLKALGDVREISLRINSAGGDVFEAQAIYSYLRNHKAQKTVRVDGIAASAASLVAMVGDKVIMPSNALMMIHNPMSWTWGEASEMREAADILDKVRDTIAAVYVAKTGLEYDKIKAMMDEETWMTAEEALALGFCDETDEAIEVAACARSLTDGDISWRTATGEARFSRALGAKMPESAKKIPLIIDSEVKIMPNEHKDIKLDVKTKEEPVLDIKNIADLEKNFPQLVTEMRDAADGAAYARGVEAERARLKALDGLSGPGREAIIAKAKYEEPKDARDIAMELLQASANVAALEARQSDASAVNAALVPSVMPAAQEAVDNAAAKVADEINAMRGYKK